jgi:hypothetical protein
MGIFFGIIGDILIRGFLATFTLFAKQTAWNIALATLSVVALGTAITLFVTIVTNVTSSLIGQAGTFPAIPYFIPSNVTTCLTAYVTVKLAGTVFNATLHFIESKSYVLKS